MVSDSDQWMVRNEDGDVGRPQSDAILKVMSRHYAQAPLCDFPCDFARMREYDALGDARKCSSSANGCAEPHCGNRISYEMSRNIGHALSQKKSSEI